MFDTKALSKQYVGGEWRDGRSTHSYTDVNPFTGETITEIRLASVDDIDEA